MFARSFSPRKLLTGSLHVLVVTAALSLGACGSDRGGEASTSASEFERLGRRVYNNQCATCHRPDGRGVEGVYPPLHGTDWVVGDEGRLIRLTLNGLRGPLVVDGQTYDNVMVPHDFLTDRQIAAVLSYVRSEFGSGASSITTSEVTAVRHAQTHEGYYTPDVLREATGIPDTTVAE